MTLQEFKVLCNAEKFNYLYRQAVYLAKRKQEDMIVLLFQVDGFYVEIFYIKYRRYISKIECFSSTGPLDPYLKQIDVEHLV